MIHSAESIEDAKGFGATFDAGCSTCSPEVGAAQVWTHRVYAAVAASRDAGVDREKVLTGAIMEIIRDEQRKLAPAQEAMLGAAKRTLLEQSMRRVDELSAALKSDLRKELER